MGTKLIVEKQKGYGQAYTIGLKAASGDILVTLDADGTYPDELIPGYIQILNEKDLFYHNK
jgi:glycosyltransferase involved in cell wall biosynthesis